MNLNEEENINGASVDRTRYTISCAATRAQQQQNLDENYPISDEMRSGETEATILLWYIPNKASHTSKPTTESFPQWHTKFPLTCMQSLGMESLKRTSFLQDTCSHIHNKHR
jgi:hypothetical protein